MDYKHLGFLSFEIEQNDAAPPVGNQSLYLAKGRLSNDLGRLSHENGLINRMENLQPVRPLLAVGIEPGILNRDSRLVGEGLQPFGLSRIEKTGFDTIEV